uniref:C-type lectin domain family 2 member D n=1 Tax=Neovison vison TaxID=452646 RepID=A0A8C7AZ65_NEOVI
MHDGNQLKKDCETVELTDSITGRKLHRISSECLEAACPESWIGFQRKCFYFSDDFKNWTFSQRFCDSHGADLVQVETIKELFSYQRRRRMCLFE